MWGRGGEAGADSAQMERSVEAMLSDPGSGSSPVKITSQLLT